MSQTLNIHGQTVKLPNRWPTDWLAYAVYRHDFEEPTKRAVSVLSVWPTKVQAEEEVCRCYIEDAQADTEAEAEDVAAQIEEGLHAR